MNQTCAYCRGSGSGQSLGAECLPCNGMGMRDPQNPRTRQTFTVVLTVQILGTASEQRAAIKAIATHAAMVSHVESAYLDSSEEADVES